MTKDFTIEDVDSIILEAEKEVKEAEDLGIYVRVPGHLIPLSVKDLTLWNWTKIFMLYVAPARDNFFKSKNN